ncbi:hypothetical protein F5I97DRAFT_1578278 [Phlebopus sp. FC_14]|nr:hypothetical protein F5I97DRAFT_1578278 [Phlebopus sp. FC_14]
MANNYIFSLTPTFTQGLLLGQLSILFLVALVLKYLFFVSSSEDSVAQTPPCRPHMKPDHIRQHPPPDELEDIAGKTCESADWFNWLARQVVDVYRAKLQDGLTGLEGSEIARERIETYINATRPHGFLDRVTVHSVNLGHSAPRLSNAQLVTTDDENSLTSVKFDMSYSDSVSISLSTAYLFNYPSSSFARLPVSLTVSLAQFESSVTLTPPSPNSSAPALTISLPPEFILRLETTSLMGSRAMLKDVPKLHELVEHQVRRVFAARGTWKVVLPGLGVSPAMEKSDKT